MIPFTKFLFLIIILKDNLRRLFNIKDIILDSVIMWFTWVRDGHS